MALEDKQEKILERKQEDKLPEKVTLEPLKTKKNIFFLSFEEYDLIIGGYKLELKLLENNINWFEILRAMAVAAITTGL